MSETRIDRIKRMETILDEANRALNDCEKTPEKLIGMQKKIRQLEAYYTGNLWLKDFEFDEKGKLPADLKRGVFSEDAVSDTLDRYKAALEHIEPKLESAVPTLEDLWFRESLMADEETMSYNHAWGGTIPFPKEDWEDWYDYWIVNHENKRFYRYLKVGKDFVGEIAYHYTSEYDGFVADVIIFSKFRGKGYGAKGLEILCKAAKENGIRVLYDDIAIDNSAAEMFIKQGFYEDYRTEDKIVLKKEL